MVDHDSLVTYTEQKTDADDVLKKRKMTDRECGKRNRKRTDKNGKNKI